MTKRMLIDDTHPEETRVVVIDGNKLEDVEFESSSRKQIKGNIYLAKIMRIEPSLQAAFVDYGGNKHGFLAFGEIHPDYYNISGKELAEIEKEVDDIIEAKKQSVKDREIGKERQREARAAYLQQIEDGKKAKEEAKEQKQTAESEDIQNVSGEPADEKNEENISVEHDNKETASEKQERKSRGRRYLRRNSKRNPKEVSADEDFDKENDIKLQVSQAIEKNETIAEVKPENNEITEQKNSENLAKEEENAEKKKVSSKRLQKKTAKSKTDKTAKNDKELKVLSENTGTDEETIREEVRRPSFNKKSSENDDTEFADIADDDIDDDEQESNFELQRKLLIARKLFHRSKIQEVLKEGQIILVQVVKEERGNKGAALTTYLSLAGRYCVLMPNRIKSGGVSRKITNAADRKRLKSILKELPLSSDMSMIVRTAGEDKTKSDIIRDYNYLVRSWNQIKTNSLKNKAPKLIHEEANLIKRALRDMYTKDISEVIVDGANAYKSSKDFIRILSPQSLKKIKTCRENDVPLFQRFQVEGQLEKLHDTTVQLESGGYLVINPTEALVAIDVNSGRATKERDLEETALKTNLEAADEIARQLRLRNLAGLVVIDFIDMEENSNNNAVEKRIKEALKKDRSRVQVGKMSCFGLIEISRQRMHPSFFETSYEVCPHCLGKGIIRTVESYSVSILREIESEGAKSRYNNLNVFVPCEVAIYLLNQKRAALTALETKYNMNVIISADNNVKNISSYRIERTKIQKGAEETVLTKENKENNTCCNFEENDNIYWEGNVENNGKNKNNSNVYKNNRFDKRKNNERSDYKNDRKYNNNKYENQKQENRESKEEKKDKSSWWKKLIGG